MYKIYKLENWELQETFMQGWLERNCTHPGGSVCRFLEAKSFTSIPPVRQILELVPKFGREFVSNTAIPRCSSAKMAPD